MPVPNGRVSAIALLLAVTGLTRPMAGQEFVQQTLIVAPLHFEGSLRVSRQVAAGIRSSLARLVNRREVRVLGADTMEVLLERSGFRYDTVISNAETLSLVRRLRADEAVIGVVTSRPNLVEVRAEIVLMRDWRLRQPLPVVRAPTVAAAAEATAQQIARGRSQMVGLRRCENAGREGRSDAAVRYAEEAVKAYPLSTLARTCLAMALQFVDVGNDSIQHVSETILGIDSLNIVAAVLRATSLAAQGRADDAADAWTRVIELRPDSLALALTATQALMRLQRPAPALAVARTLIRMHDGDVRFRRLAFRANIALSRWKDAALLGDSLDAEDGEFREDSAFAIRHVEALRLSGDTLGAVAKSARSVKQHPGDLLLYLQYVKLVAGEGAWSLSRGLALFPESSEMHVLSARAALTTGKRRDAIHALVAAVARDSTLTQGFLQIADLWFDEQQPDSAVAAVARAPRGGDGVSLVRAYAIARGRREIRSATDSTPESWHRAISLFAIADSLASESDSRSLIAAATLQLGRSELVIATRTRDCTHATRAHAVLDVSASALARGVGDGSGASELQAAYDQMRPYVDNAVKVLCGGGKP